MSEHFLSSKDIQTIQQARKYLRSRMKDAVLCWKRTEPKFKNPIVFAQYLARYW